ncbi:MAG: signal peptidase [Capsulimonas sp.]|nr:signal peptidase [Capsulimonas sp.]
MPTSNITETLANLSIVWILVLIAGATVLRLVLVRSASALARSAAEFLESGVIAIALVFLILRPFIVQAYFIPSPSMEPTLLGENGSGDRILVNKLDYRLRSPQRDNVVVFIPPAAATEGSPNEPSGAPINYIKRLIGLPGDVLQTTAGRVYINGMPYTHTNIRDKFALVGLFGEEMKERVQLEPQYDTQASYHVRFRPDAVLINGVPVPKSRIGEIVTGFPGASVRIEPGVTRRNGIRIDEPFTAEDPDYDLQISDGKSLKRDGQNCRLDGDEISPEKYDLLSASPAERIPSGHFFMMGDNRNDSKDSTEWGPLEANRVVGKAQFIFWPLRRMRAIQ